MPFEVSNPYILRQTSENIANRHPTPFSADIYQGARLSGPCLMMPAEIYSRSGVPPWLPTCLRTGV